MPTFYESITVGTVNKSMEKVLCRWLCKNVCHVWDGGFVLYFLIILEIVRSEILSIPGFINSPCILGAPQSRFSFAIFSMIFRISGSTGDRPGPLFLDLYRQNSLNPFLCQRITVSGFTTINTSCQSFHKQDRNTQNIRSLVRIFGRLMDCFMVSQLLPKSKILDNEMGIQLTKNQKHE